MRDQAVGVDVDVAMGEHDALGAGRGAGGVVDRHQVVFVPFRCRRLVGRHSGEHRIPVNPAGDFGALVGGCDPQFHRGQALANGVDHGGVFVIHQHGLDAGVIDDELVVLRDESIIQRHQDGADSAGGVETLQKKMRIGTQDAHPVALADAPRKQGVGELVDALLVLPVGESELAVDDRGFAGIKAGRARQKVVYQ